MYVSSREATQAAVRARPSPLTQSYYAIASVSESQANSNLSQICADPGLGLGEKLVSATAAFISKETPMVQLINRLVV
jgi:hypothetical protein